MIGLSLRGFGSATIGIIGALKVFDEKKIKPELIIATNESAIISALYLLKFNNEEIIKILKEMKFSIIEAGKNIFTDHSILPADFFEEKLSKYIGNSLLQDLNLVVRATNSDTGESIILKEGRVMEALKATNSLPLFSKPISIEGIELIAGNFSACNTNQIFLEYGIVKTLEISTIQKTDSIDLNDRIASLFSPCQQIQEIERNQFPLDLYIDIQSRTTFWDFESHIDEVDKVYKQLSIKIDFYIDNL